MSLHPIFAQALRPFAPPERLEAQVANAVRLFTAPTCPKGLIEWHHEKLLSGCTVVCHFEADEGEPMTRDDPGYPASFMLVAAYVRDVDVLEMLSPDQVEQIERDAIEALENIEEENRAETLYEAAISRREYCEER